jgi:hypothetical protein
MVPVHLVWNFFLMEDGCSKLMLDALYFVCEGYRADSILSGNYWIIAPALLLHWLLVQ